MKIKLKLANGNQCKYLIFLAAESWQLEPLYYRRIPVAKRKLSDLSARHFAKVKAATQPGHRTDFTTHLDQGSSRMVEACWGIETYSHIAYTCIHMHTLDRWVWLIVYLQSYVGSLRCSVLLLASSDGYKANENKPGLLSPKTPLSTRSMNLSSWNIAVDKGSYTLYAHTHRHTQIQDCASHLDFMVTMKKTIKFSFVVTEAVNVTDWKVQGQQGVT